MIELLAIGGAVVAIVAVFAGVVWLAERKGAALEREEQRNAEMQRLRDALEADSRARERLARGELLQDDGFRRD